MSNLDQILSYMRFESEDDFYYLQILQRKKENKTLNSNSRVIKNYYISNKQYLIDRFEEIKTLCKVFNARAMIRLNRRSFKKVAFKSLSNIANTLSSQEYKFINKQYDRACGQSSNGDRSWIIDLDGNQIKLKNNIVDYINAQMPKGNKLLLELPSKSGIHLIVKPFNKQYFNDQFPNVEIHKDNPTNLFIP